MANMAMEAFKQSMGPRMEQPEKENEFMQNPASATDIGGLFLPKDITPKGLKAGDEITVKGTVTTVGSKVGFTPNEVSKEGGLEVESEVE